MPLKPKRPTFKHSRRGKKSWPQTILENFWHISRRGWRVCRAFLKAVWTSPPLVRVTLLPVLLFFLWFGVNVAFQTYHKPSEMLFPLDRSFNKHPTQTWKEYEPLFREHATAIITPELLAALAQAEGGGNPVARTYWRWELTWNPFTLYQPASSAVGMYQITDGTFDEAAQYCIHDHQVVEEGPWHDFQSCWFNSLYLRILPSHAIELTAAYLHSRVTQTIGLQRMSSVSLEQKQNLAAIIHLCGAGAGRAYAARGFRLTPHQRCGTHNPRKYLKRINELKDRFAHRARKTETIRQAH